MRFGSIGLWIWGGGGLISGIWSVLLGGYPGMFPSLRVPLTKLLMAATHGSCVLYKKLASIQDVFSFI